jgi:D-3-phosphoglycerate dehydrogenase
MMRDVLVTENIVGSEMESLRGRYDVAFEPELWRTPDRLQEMIADFRALIVRNQTRVTSGLIASGPHLQVIGRAGAGLDNIDLDAATSAGIVVAYTPEQNALSVAELTIGMMLALARKIVPADRTTKAGEWKRRESTGIELYGKTLGLVGLGRIGYRVGGRAKAFGMDIVAYDLYANPDAIAVSESFARMMDLDELLDLADFVSCHVPLTAETVGLFDYERFCRMKSTAYFINTSRGEVVDEEALAQALKEERIAGAGLDVRQKEPPDKGPLSEMDNVLLTPHIGAFTKESQERVVSSVCRDVAAILGGGEAKNYFNISKPKRM